MGGRAPYVKCIAAGALAASLALALIYVAGIPSELATVGAIVFLTAIFAVRDFKRSREIKRITNIMTEINEGKYTLDITGEREDELSILEDELRKMCVRLREAAELSESDRVVLKKSVEDISHQIKTPLTSISITLDNLSDNPDLSEEKRQEFYGDIRREIRHVNFMVSTLLKLGQLEASTVSFNAQQVRVGDLVGDAVVNTSALADLKDVTVKVEGDEDACVNCDRQWQAEALTNIIKNSIEHSPSGSPLEIVIRDKKISVEIAVTDHGTGIPQKEISHIFERFYSRKASSGVGIGLVLAKSIIEAEGGFISVISEEGKGTTFKIEYV